MRRLAWAVIVGAPVGATRSPVDVLVREPKALDMHVVEHLGDALACRRYSPAARLTRPPAP
jgi:hypothetical protein